MKGKRKEADEGEKRLGSGPEGPLVPGGADGKITWSHKRNRPDAAGGHP